MSALPEQPGLPLADIHVAAGAETASRPAALGYVDRLGTRCCYY